MEISILLAEKIASMLLACFVGFIVVRGGLFGTKECTTFSKIVAYICSPCAIFSAYMVDFSMERLQGLFIAVIVALLWHIAVIGITNIFGRTFDLNRIEQTSIIYTNAGYLVIPVVYAVLGSEWVFYTSAFSMIQTQLVWSHGRSTICGEKKVEWKKVLLNPNFIAVYAGLTVFIFRISFPGIIETSISDFGTMVGTLSMFVIGMLIGSQKLRTLFNEKRVYVVCFLRLFVIPVITVVAFWGVQKIVTLSDINSVLMIVLWAACAPVGATVTQLCQLFGEDSEYASKINLVSLLFCVVTMPLITYFYIWMCGI